MNWRRKAVLLGIYLALLLPSLFVASCIWDSRVSDVLYYCSDSVPFELFSHGPFAHLDVQRYGNTGDYYVASEERLHQIQRRFLFVALVVPALVLFIISLFIRRHRTPNSNCDDQTVVWRGALSRLLR